MESTNDIIEYIDRWLADTPHVLDHRTIDFALDVRSMVEAMNTAPAPAAREPVSV